ncbi:MAG: putative chitinase [Myxococcota bacterium]|jgi:predicted chitinase
MAERNRRPRPRRGQNRPPSRGQRLEQEEFGSNSAAQDELQSTESTTETETKTTVTGTTEWATGMLTSTEESTQYESISDSYEEQTSQPSVTGDAVSNGATYTAAPTLDDIYQGGEITEDMAGPAVAQIQSALTRLGFSILTTGLLGETTLEVIKDFQEAYKLQQTGEIDMHDLERIDEALTCSITLAQLQEIAPTISDANATSWLPFLNASMWEASINSDARKAAYIAQLAHESDGFQTLEEYASGAGYEGREDLGNTEEGDGKRFKGRGPIQITGRYNYGTYGEQLGVDLVNNPELAATPEVGFRIAAAYWANNDLNDYADSGEFNTITSRINGGQNGADSRRAYWGTAKDSLGDESDITSASQMSSTVDPEVLAEMARSLPENDAAEVLKLIQGQSS